MFLLDTSVVSELRKPRPHGAVLAWYRSYPLRELALPSIALFEMQAGVELTRVHDATKADEIDNCISRIAEKLKVVALDGASARLAARWMHGKPTELMEDALIAAIASTHRLVIATRNVRHFEQFPVSLTNPFTP